MRENEFAVLCAEAETGIVLSNEGGWALGAVDCYRVFPSAEQAFECGRQLVSTNPLCECLVFDHHATVIRTYRDEVALRAALLRKKARRSWWSRWFERGEGGKKQ